MSKKIIALIMSAIMASLIVAMVNSTYSTVGDKQDYLVNGSVVFAYFNTYNVSDTVGGLGSKTLVSYIFVLNITNCNNETVSLDTLLVTLHDSAVKTGNSVSGATEIIRYKRSFADNELSYQWSADSSKLVAFTATGELDDLELDALKTGEVFLLVHLNGLTPEGDHVGSDLNLKEVSLDIVSETEYVYNTAFMNNHSFSFRNDTPDVSHEW